MTLNGNSRTAIMTAVLTAVVVIFVMLFTGFTGSVREVQGISRENRERIVAVEVKIENIVKKLSEIHLDQKEMKNDLKEILRVLK